MKKRKKKKENNKIFILESFDKYIEDNIRLITGLGVFATITALFLNLSIDQFGDSLKFLQLLLLILLFIFLVFFSAITAIWIIKNADSYFGSIIFATLLLLLYYFGRFAVSNYSSELKSYTVWISWPVLLIVFGLLKNLFAKFRRKISDSRYKEVFYILGPFFIYIIFFSYAHIFSVYTKSGKLEFSGLLSFLFDPSFLIFMAWMVFADLIITYIWQKPKKWQILLVFSPVVIYLIYGVYLIYLAIRY